ncbi:TonB-dependent receptor [Croceicoccus ponticola]|nr:TonB-dependent receptor plug domain-containing protein [Croceicoccus ponticola]
MASQFKTMMWSVPILAALQCSTAMAQTVAAAADGDTVSAADQTGSAMGEIVVTAQRREGSLARTPVAVSVLSQDTLAEQAIVSEADLQTAIPGLTVKAGQSDNQLNYSLRGQSVDSFSFSRPSVLPYVNEVQVGGASSTAFYDLQSIQVLKGPQGTLFGRNSTGGAVLFTTAKPDDDLGGYVSLRGGNYSHVQAEGAINVPLVEDTVLLRVAGFFQRRDGYQRNLFDGGRLGDVKKENVRGSLTIKPSLSFTNDLMVEYGHSGGDNLSSVIYNILPRGAGGAFVPNNILYSPDIDSLFGPGVFAAFLAAHPGADPEGIVAFAAKQQARGPYIVDVDAPNFHRSKSLTVTNTSTLEIGPNTSIKNIVGYVRQKAFDASEFDGTSFPADSNGADGRGGTLKQFSEELQILGDTFGNTLTYVAGLYYSDETLDNRSLSVILDLTPIAPPINQINDARIDNTSYAVYAQGTLDLSDMINEGLGITLGGRYSSEKVTITHQNDDIYLTNPNPAFVNPLSETFKKFSWHVGLEQQVNPSLLLYAVSRRSFRSGGFNFFAPPLPGVGNEGGAGYSPETALDVELGLKYQGEIGTTPVRFNLAAYNMWIDDIQRSNYVEIFGSLAGITVNVPKAEVTGIEVDGVISPTSWLNIGGNVNYTDARFTSNIVSVLGNPAVAFDTYPDTPEWSGVAFAEIKAPVSSNLTATLHGDVYAQTSTYFSSTGNTLNPGTKIPGYTLVNFRAGIEDDVAGWSLTANLKNAFDRTYYVGGIGFLSLLAVNTVIPGAPRTFLLEARKKF